ncbi:MAG TPA: hypothetical protein VH277_15005 [Gemmatimonadaceae bacterium]|jgi:intracellular sulfur oxidation DsrE/DsrF family protein|nr:hypothetical protein [Gemmatimonadaceae bacterium]
MAAGAAAAAVGGWPRAADAEMPTAVGSGPVGDQWLARIKGKHKQYFDVVTPNPWGLAFGLNYLDSTKTALSLPDQDLTAVVGFRHMSMPLTLNDAMWAKYRIGEIIDVKDPKTNAPATRNIFRDNVPMRAGLTYEQAIAQRGLVVVACNMALTVLSGMAAPKAGTTADKAKADWTANLLPGVFLAPSGVYAVNRSQEAGCTYCFGT